MSYPIDLRETSFEVIKLFNKKVLFTPDRVDKATLPKGMYLYELRHDDEGSGDIVQMGKGILVNFYGTIISDEPFKLDNNYKDVNEDSDIEFTDEILKISQYKGNKSLLITR